MHSSATNIAACHENRYSIESPLTNLEACSSLSVAGFSTDTSRLAHIRVCTCIRYCAIMSDSTTGQLSALLLLCQQAHLDGRRSRGRGSLQTGPESRLVGLLTLPAARCAIALAPHPNSPALRLAPLLWRILIARCLWRDPLAGVCTQINGLLVQLRPVACPQALPMINSIFSPLTALKGVGLLSFPVRFRVIF